MGWRQPFFSYSGLQPRLLCPSCESRTWRTPWRCSCAAWGMVYRKWRRQVPHRKEWRFWRPLICMIVKSESVTIKKKNYHERGHPLQLSRHVFVGAHLSGVALHLLRRWSHQSLFCPCLLKKRFIRGWMVLYVDSPMTQLNPASMGEVVSSRSWP